ncbi:unnamed protein product, partial [Trichogramma brassicae]
MGSFLFYWSSETSKAAGQLRSAQGNWDPALVPRTSRPRRRSRTRRPHGNANNNNDSLSHTHYCSSTREQREDDDVQQQAPVIIVSQQQIAAANCVTGSSSSSSSGENRERSSVLRRLDKITRDRRTVHNNDNKYTTTTTTTTTFVTAAQTTTQLVCSYTVHAQFSKIIKAKKCSVRRGASAKLYLALKNLENFLTPSKFRIFYDESNGMPVCHQIQSFNPIRMRNRDHPSRENRLPSNNFAIATVEHRTRATAHVTRKPRIRV